MFCEIARGEVVGGASCFFPAGEKLLIGCFQEEYDDVITYLNLEMGRDLKTRTEQVPINFTKDEINTYISRCDSDPGAGGREWADDEYKHGFAVPKTHTHSTLSAAWPGVHHTPNC